MLTKKDENKIKDIVVGVIEDVVLPAFETVSTKTDLVKTEHRLDNRLNKVENRLEQVDRRLDIFSDKVVVQANQIEDHQKRIKKIEHSRISA
jgi:septal ring factor EnvC (AmiA/AmiB activator)